MFNIVNNLRQIEMYRKKLLKKYINNTGYIRVEGGVNQLFLYTQLCL